MAKIIWVDDDINRSMRAYVDEIEDSNGTVIKINHPDKFLDIYEHADHDILIMDIMMPRGKRLTAEETKFGYETGVALIELYRKQYPSKRIIVFSILPDDSVRNIASKLKVQYKSKRNVTPFEFSNFIFNNE